MAQVDRAAVRDHRGLLGASGRVLATKLNASGAALKDVWNAGMLMSLEMQRRLFRGVAREPSLLMGAPESPTGVRGGRASDNEVFQEVLGNNGYGVIHIENPRVIIDVGGNVGYSALYFAAKYPNATIYTFEPDPRNYELLCRNTAQIHRIKAYQAALTPRNGSVDLYVKRKAGMSSSLRKRSGFSPVSVRAASLDTFLSRARIDHVDLLKFNIEGGEQEMFENFKQLGTVSALIGQVHEDLMNIDLEDFLQLLPGFELATRRLSPTRALVWGVRNV